MEEAFEEGQGPHRAVEPMMMMDFVHCLNYEITAFKGWILLS
jgi:hypothetical protein